MSDSTSAPAAPAAIPAAAQPATPAPPSNTNTVNAPAPASQPAISLSDAGRMLAKARADGAREPQQPQPARPAVPATPAATPAAPAAAPAEAKPASSYDAIARALGGEAPPAAADASAPAEAAPMGGLEIDGQRYSQQQLRQAVLQSQDYTRKTQELAAQRQQLQQQAEALATVLPHIQPELQKLGQQLQGTPPPDHTLIDSNPQEYLRQFHAYQQAAAEQQRLGSLSTLQQQALERHISQQVEAGNKVLAEKYEFWRDDTMRAQVQRDIANWAQSEGGFTKQELQSLTDPRHVQVMMRAMMYDRMVKGSTTTAPPQIQTARARGTAPPPPQAATVQAAETSFDTTPNIRTGTALLSARRSSPFNGYGRH